MPSAQVTISQLPAAGAITGTELVPIVQNGLTVHTTTGAISASPSQTQTFITVNQEPTLPNSRSLAGNNGITLVDGGAQNPLTISLTGTALSLQNASDGLLYKVSGSIVPRTLVSGSSGIAVTNGDGVSGNPAIALSGRVLAFEGLGGSSGLVALTSGGVTSVNIVGTANQINVANGAGPSNPTLSIASNPTIPGTGGMVIPKGTTAQEPIGVDGQIRFNTDTVTFDGYSNGQWRQFTLAGGVSTFSAGATGLTPNSPTSGVVTLGGILNPASGGTGFNNGSYSINLGGSIITEGVFRTYGAFSLALTATGATNVTLPTTGTLATLAGSETLTNKTIDAANNTLSNIGNSSLTNSSLTFNGVSVSLGGSGTITANTPNAVTFNNTGGSAAGTTFNGGTAITVDYSTVGAPKADGTGASGTWNINISGNAATATSATSATTATNATNVATTATSTNTDFYIPFVAASTTGNQALGVDAGLSYNPSTNALTGGISGGTF